MNPPEEKSFNGVYRPKSDVEIDEEAAKRKFSGLLRTWLKSRHAAHDAARDATEPGLDSDEEIDEADA